ncbi:MAG TPA: protein kinase, partial [Ktedonobacteraceae bacterium]|nr:protein kinase [Ktedonobacteraceae bacterium]
MRDRVGQQIGHYRFVKLLGTGGFAEVYLGEHIHLGTKAAVKVLRTQITQQDRAGFLTEARTIARMEHANIVRVLDFGFDEHDSPYLVMNYAPGGSLRDLFPKSTPVSLQTVIPYVSKVAAALQYAHDTYHVVHRDVKPENMLRNNDGEVFLSDFGISVIARSSIKQEVAGTAPYMAPEQIRGAPHFASDQYALAIVVYEWLTGERPFTGSFAEICSQHLLKAPPPLHIHIPTIPPAVEQVVLIALNKDPDQRFHSVKAFAHALEQASHPEQGISSSYSIRLSSVCLRCGTLLAPNGQYCSSCGYHNSPTSKHSTQQPAFSTSMPTSAMPPSALYSTITSAAHTRQSTSTSRSQETPGADTISTMPHDFFYPSLRQATKQRNWKQNVAGILVIVLLIALGVASYGYVTHQHPFTHTPATRPSTTASCISPTGQQVLFIDCFADNQHGWNTYSQDPNQYSITIDHDSLVLENRLPGLLSERLPDQTFGNFTLTVDATLSQGAQDDSYGIYMRAGYDPAKGLLVSYYRFELYGDGSYAIYKGTPNSPDTLLKPRSIHPVVQKRGNTNHITIKAQGSTMAFSINGAMLTSISDQTYANGETALFVGNLSKSSSGSQAIFK